MSGRVIEATDIEKTVEKLCVEANTVLRPDVLKALEEAHALEEKGSQSERMLGVLLENAKIAKDTGLPICQDTGMVSVFIDMGKEVVVEGGNIFQAVDEGVERSYEKNFFRKSVVDDPILRNNTGTNTPAITHVDLVPGDHIKISVLPKGFGCENKSRLVMLNPTCGQDEIVEFCVDTVRMSGPDACPPYVLGIGLGGTAEKCAYLAKKALLRPVGSENPKEHIAKIEREIKQKANALNVGVMGLGGKTTVMQVSIEEFPTHIAGLPVAVNISCNALRSATAEL